jgi:hypothetical protein
MHSLEFDYNQKRTVWIDIFKDEVILYYNKLTEKIEKWKKSF